MPATPARASSRIRARHSPYRRAGRGRGCARRDPARGDATIVETRGPGAARTADRDAEADVLHRPQRRAERAHLLERRPLEADDDVVVAEQRARCAQRRRGGGSGAASSARPSRRCGRASGRAPLRVSDRRAPGRGRSWVTTSRPAASAWTSSSTKSAPSSIARSNAGSVFSGSSEDAPRCAMTSISPARAHHVDVDAVDELVGRTQALRIERSLLREHTHARGLRRGDAGLRVLEDDTSPASIVEELERLQVALGMRLALDDVVGGDDPPKEGSKPGSLEDRLDLGASRARADRERHARRGIANGVTHVIVDRRAVGDCGAVALDALRDHARRCRDGRRRARSGRSPDRRGPRARSKYSCAEAACRARRTAR